MIYMRIWNQKIRKLEKSLKIKKDELVKQKLLENRINLFEKRIAETEKEIESQSIIENRIILIKYWHWGQYKIF